MRDAANHFCGLKEKICCEGEMARRVKTSKPGSFLSRPRCRTSKDHEGVGITLLVMSYNDDADRTKCVLQNFVPHEA